MEAVITSVGEKAGELAFDLIKHEITYILNYKSNVENLREGIDDLKDARRRVQQSVDAAKRKGRKIYKGVEKWLSMVDQKISKEAAAKLKEDEDKAANERCFIGFVPNLKSRYQLSKKAEKEAHAIAQLLEKGRFDSVSYLPAPQGTCIRSVKGYKAFDSRTGSLNAVMEALKNGKANIVGVYGMGRAPMTTLVKEIARLAKAELFDKVAIATITQTLNIEKIQNEIAQNLGLNFDDASLDAKRVRLLDRLKKEKVLIILDDIWVTLDLEVLGIPSRSENMGCKILLTSRKFNVLSSMGVEKPFAINVFNIEEAWKLFKNMAADIVERSNSYCKTIELAQKCADLPIAIAAIAETLKNKKTLFELKNASQELERPFSRNFKSNFGNAYTLDVGRGWDWADFDQVDFASGSFQILVDFSLGSFRVRITPGTNYLQFSLFQVRIIFISEQFQIWITSNE